MCCCRKRRSRTRHRRRSRSNCGGSLAGKLLPTRLLAQDRGERVGRAVAGEEPPAGQALEQADAERPEVGSRIDGGALGLLGRHVGRRPEDLATHGGGESQGGGVGRRPHRVIGDVGHQRLGQTEVEDLDVPGRGHLDVGGLEVAVDDALLVRCLEAFRDLQEERDRLVDRDRAASDAIGQRLAVDQLHDQEARGLLGLEPVQGGDVGVVERGQHPRLTLEPGEPLGVLCHRLRQHLDRNLAVESGVPGSVHHTHAARAEDGDDLVLTQAGARSY